MHYDHDTKISMKFGGGKTGRNDITVSMCNFLAPTNPQPQQHHSSSELMWFDVCSNQTAIFSNEFSWFGFPKYQPSSNLI